MYNRRSFLQYIVPILSGSLLAPAGCITNGLKEDGDTYRKDAVSKMKQKQGLKKSHKPLYGHNNVGFVGHHSTTSPLDDQSEKKNIFGQDCSMSSNGDIQKATSLEKKRGKKGKWGEVRQDVEGNNKGKNKKVKKKKTTGVKKKGSKQEERKSSPSSVDGSVPTQSVVTNKDSENPSKTGWYLSVYKWYSSVYNMLFSTKKRSISGGKWEKK